MLKQSGSSSSGWKTKKKKKGREYTAERGRKERFENGLEAAGEPEATEIFGESAGAERGGAQSEGERE